MFTLMTGGRRSGRERKGLPCPGPRDSALARVRAVGPQPRAPASAIQAVPAVKAPRNFRRVIPALRFLFLVRLPKSALSSLASVATPDRAKPLSPARPWERGVGDQPTPLHTSGSHEGYPTRTTSGPSRSFRGHKRLMSARTLLADRPDHGDLP